MRGVGCRGNVTRWTSCSFQSADANLGSLPLDHLPRGVVDSYAVLANDQRVGVPQPLRVEAGATVIDGGECIANGEAHLLADRRNAVEVGHAWVAAGAVQLPGPVDNSEHVLHGEGHSRHRVVLEDWQADHHRAHTGENPRQADVCRSPADRRVLVSRDVGAEAANAARVCVYGEAADFEIFAVAVPDYDVAGLDAGVLQTFDHGQDEREVRADALAAKAVGLESDDLVRTKILAEDELPGFDGIALSGPGCDGAIEQGHYAILVELAEAGVHMGIARHDDARLAGGGVWLRHGDFAQCGLRAHQQGSCGGFLQKLSAVLHRVPRSRRRGRLAACLVRVSHPRHAPTLWLGKGAAFLPLLDQFANGV